MRTPVATVLLLALLCPNAGAQTAEPRGTWAATASNGLKLAGTWTATVDQKTGTVTGTWTLFDAQGRTAANGAWSAAKSPSGWSGNWRAAAAGRAGEYTGTWSADVKLKPAAGFAELFEQAVKDLVSGTWRSAGRNGAWSIRAADPK